MGSPSLAVIHSFIHKCRIGSALTSVYPLSSTVDAVAADTEEVIKFGTASPNAARNLHRFIVTDVRAS